jgi:Fe-S oxidoreductase
VAAQVVHFIDRPMPAGLPAKTMRSLLWLDERNVVPIIRDSAKQGASSDAVFYFPGCGSERLFSQVGLATLAMLYSVGTQTVLPPGYLCCGYPQRASGRADAAHAIVTANRVLFHRLANAISYLDIRTVLVSCGTCLDQLQHYEFQKIFPGCRLMDIHEYLAEKGVRMQGISGVKYVYHDPCHSPMKIHDAELVVKALTGQKALASKSCCGESGTLAISRPDISTQLRLKKRESLQEAQAAAQSGDPEQHVKVLTSCPSCLQGLARFEPDTGMSADYLVVELANQLLGHDWQGRYLENVHSGGIERVVL